MVEELSKKLQNISLKQAVTDDCFPVRPYSNNSPEISKTNKKKLTKLASNAPRLRAQKNSVQYFYRQLDQYKDSEIEHLINKNDERVGELWVEDLPMSWEFAKGCFFAGEMKGYRSRNLEEEYE